jgi:hypothetical protein
MKVVLKCPGNKKHVQASEEAYERHLRECYYVSIAKTVFRCKYHETHFFRKMKDKLIHEPYCTYKASFFQDPCTAEVQNPFFKQVRHDAFMDSVRPVGRSPVLASQLELTSSEMSAQRNVNSKETPKSISSQMNSDFKSPSQDFIEGLSKNMINLQKALYAGNIPTFDCLNKIYKETPDSRPLDARNASSEQLAIEKLNNTTMQSLWYNNELVRQLNPEATRAYAQNTNKKTYNFNYRPNEYGQSAFYKDKDLAEIDEESLDSIKFQEELLRRGEFSSSDKKFSASKNEFDFNLHEGKENFASIQEIKADPLNLITSENELGVSKPFNFSENQKLKSFLENFNFKNRFDLDNHRSIQSILTPIYEEFMESYEHVNNIFEIKEIVLKFMAHSEMPAIGCYVLEEIKGCINKYSVIDLNESELTTKNENVNTFITDTFFAGYLIFNELSLKKLPDQVGSLLEMYNSNNDLVFHNYNHKSFVSSREFAEHMTALAAGEPGNQDQVGTDFQRAVHIFPCQRNSPLPPFSFDFPCSKFEDRIDLPTMNSSCNANGKHSLVESKTDLERVENINSNNTFYDESVHQNFYFIKKSKICCILEIYIVSFQQALEVQARRATLNQPKNEKVSLQAQLKLCEDKRKDIEKFTEKNKEIIKERRAVLEGYALLQSKNFQLKSEIEGIKSENHKLELYNKMKDQLVQDSITNYIIEAKKNFSEHYQTDALQWFNRIEYLKDQVEKSGQRKIELFSIGKSLEEKQTNSIKKFNEVVSSEKEITEHYIKLKRHHADLKDKLSQQQKEKVQTKSSLLKSGISKIGDKKHPNLVCLACGDKDRCILILPCQCLLYCTKCFKKMRRLKVQNCTSCDCKIKNYLFVVHPKASNSDFDEDIHKRRKLAHRNRGNEIIVD